jgi:hypothetical protein
VRQNYAAGLPPYADQSDRDSDSVVDVLDNCPDDANPLQENLDNDTLGDACDPDDDNDGVTDNLDDGATNPEICADSDMDGCDDCAIGQDGFGPLSDVLPDNDGPDLDGDGLCDVGDTDDDADGIADLADNCARVANPDQADSNGNGIGDRCDESERLCVPLVTSSQRVVTVCL